MYNHKLVLSYTGMLVAQVLSMALFSYLYWVRGSIDGMTLLLSWTLIMIIVDSVFFVLIMIFQWEQIRYKVLGVTSILISLTFMAIMYRYFNQGYLLSFFSDVNLFSAAVFIFISGYILVDDTTYPFVKGILATNMILMLLFRTPLFFVTLFTIHGFFQASDSIFMTVFMVLFVIHVMVSLLLGILKIKMMNRIDFL
jgi:hypothetical protein